MKIDLFKKWPIFALFTGKTPQSILPSSLDFQQLSPSQATAQPLLPSTLKLSSSPNLKNSSPPVAHIFDSNSLCLEYTLWGLFKFIFPLFVSQLSANIMLAMDRVVVMYYSLDAMNAVAMAGSACSLYTALFVPCASIISVWVGQYYGARENHNIGAIVWQMIYFGLFLSLIFIPLACFTEEVCLLPPCYREHGIAYQAVLTAFSGMPVIITAFSSFFIGIGKTKVSTFVILFGNVVNFLLNFVFVFGYWFIPSYGAVGAAYATVIAFFLQLFIFIIIFFTKENIKKFHLFNVKFDKKKLWDCLRTGMPISIGHMSTLAAWYAIYLILGYTSKDLATLEGFSVTFYVIFLFFTDAMNKAAAAIVANLIGQDKIHLIDGVTKNLFYINIIVAFLVAIPMLFKGDLLFNFLLLTGEPVQHLQDDFINLLQGLWAILFVDGYIYILSGILTSGADTYYILLVNAVSTWVLVFVPVLIMFYTNTLTSIIHVNSLSVLNAIICCVVFYYRYKSKKWLRKII